TTNSSSSTYILPPNKELLKITTEKLGFSKIEVRLQRDAAIQDYAKDFSEDKNIDLDSFKSEEELYEAINNAYLDGTFKVSVEDDPFSTWPLYQCVEYPLEVIITDKNGDIYNLNEILSEIDKCLRS